MSILKFGHAAVVTPMVCPGKWVNNVTPKGRVKVAKNVLAKFDPSKWLLSHVTIMASVDVDLDDPNDPKSNYLIKPEYSIFVNNNGDSWERKLLKSASKTFLGADNFVEHVQIPELSKGKVIDVALREVPFTKDADGNDLDTLYVDILIATNKNHKDLINKIQSGEYNATSMGCLIKYSQCSKCGRIAEDESQACKHIRYFKHNSFYDKNGIKRIIAELCGRAEEPDSCKFIDASWVRKPAFEGAVLSKIIPFDEDLSDKIQKAVVVPSFEYTPGMYLKAASEMASSVVNEIEAGKEENPKGPADDINFPDAPPETEQPLGEGGEGDLGAPGGMPPMGGGMGGGMPGVEDQSMMPAGNPTYDQLKTQLLQQLMGDIVNDIQKMKDEKQEEEALPSERPVELENASNSNLVKDACMKKVFAEAKYFNDKKLINGLMILSNLKNWKQFKKYGYNRKDVLGILHFVDKYISKNPIGIDAVKSL
jgi:hypothetical protein